MFKIITKKVLTDNIKLMEIYAPNIAKKAQPGQFIILRATENGERIPLTISNYDAVKGTITIVFQEVGKTTSLLGTLNKNDYILDFVGPLGNGSHFCNVKKAVIVAGGLGVAMSYSQAKRLNELGATVDVVAGFRNKDFVILEDQLKSICQNVYITTDDGSRGEKGFVTTKLQHLLEQFPNYDLVVVSGPLVMMKAVSNLTKQYNVKTTVSMSTIMIDGTGMCGGCRVTIDGKIKFACVDGPDFDGHKVDFDEAIRRQSMYKLQEDKSNHLCRMGDDNHEK